MIATMSPYNLVDVHNDGLKEYANTDPVASKSLKLLNAASSCPGNKIPLAAERKQTEIYFNSLRMV